MRYASRSQYDMLIRTCNFGEVHGHRFPEGSSAHDALSIIRAEVARIEALAATEHVASRSARVARKTDARRQLVDILVRAANTAWVLSRSIPELSGHAEAPVRVGDRQLVTFARGFVTAATPYTAQFAAHGIAIENLGSSIETLETALAARSTRRDELAQTRERLEESLKRALQALDTLDVIVANTFTNDPVTLASWKRERRLDLPRRRGRAGVRPGVTPAAAASAAALEPVAPAVPAESVAPMTDDVASETTTEAA